LIENFTVSSVTADLIVCVHLLVYLATCIHRVLYLCQVRFIFIFAYSDGCII